jgi:uncharacterized protein
MSQPTLYRTFQYFLSGYFKQKVQKISLNAGFTCPNRDGSKGFGGCTYCNNQTFNPAYCEPGKSITCQLEEGIRFFRKKYPSMAYLAYFQAYTSTYETTDTLIKLYEEALKVPGVRGLVIGTRPDCMPDSLLDYLENLSKRVFVLIEYGIESTLDRTLERINRKHSFSCSAETIKRTAARNIPVGAHLIIGLPGESTEDLLNHASVLNELPLNTIKLHHLQLIKGTQLAKEVEKDPLQILRFSAESYADLVIHFLELLRPDIAVERFVSQSPPNLLIYPDWGLKNYEFTHMVEQKMRERGSYQGKLVT